MGKSGERLGAGRTRTAPGLQRLAAGACLAVLAAAACAPGVAVAQATAASLGGPNKPFTIGVQETTSYDSNPARGDAQNAAIRGLSSGDVTLSPSVTAVYSRSVGLQGLAINADFGYDYHTTNNSLSREHLDFSGVGNFAVGGFCSLGANASFSRGQSPLQTLTVDVTQNTVDIYKIGGSESCRTAGGLTESINVSHSGTDNSAAGLVNYDTNEVSGLIGYTNAAIGTVGLTLGYDRTQSHAGRLVTTFVPDVLQVVSVGAQISRPFGARLTGSASVSYSHSTDTIVGLPSFFQPSAYSGLTSDVALGYKLGPRLNLTADVNRSVSGSVLEGVQYSIVTSASLGANYTVSSRISAGIGGSWAHTDYRGLSPLVTTTTPDWQETATFYVQSSIRIGRRASASLAYHHVEGRSPLSLYDYTSDYVGLTLATSF